MEQDADNYSLKVGIFEADSYRAAKERFNDPFLMEDVESGFTCYLARDPYYGSAVPFTKELFYFETASFYPRVPTFRVLYRYAPNIDPFNVELLSIEMANNEPNNNDG